MLGWRLGDRSDMAERIVLEMAIAQRVILEENRWLPWFLLKDWANGATVAGDAKLALPADFLMEVEEGHMYLTTNEGKQVRLEKQDYDTAKAMTSDSDPSQPLYYARQGNFFYFFPTPDSVYPLDMQYYAQDTDMSLANVETNWLKYAPDLVLAVVGKELVEKHIQNPEQIAGFANDAAAAWERLYAKHIAMQEVNAARYMGGGE
jgi:hypothetical protein